MTVVVIFGMLQARRRMVSRMAKNNENLKNIDQTGNVLNWFVFDGSDFNTCAPGQGFHIPYEGTNYHYEFPVPGCGTKSATHILPELSKIAYLQ